ncbi:Nucleotidylyl transferase [Schizophyllum commune H4-8]|nr:Nucleotidylyl transferase [Schizophyllum commune H4-8]KAI5884887.1 Nucleotidylyl transferase [Schizophyllum commune H4-8]
MHIHFLFQQIFLSSPTISAAAGPYLERAYIFDFHLNLRFSKGLRRLHAPAIHQRTLLQAIPRTTMTSNVTAMEVLEARLAEFQHTKGDIEVIWTPSTHWLSRPLRNLSILDSSFNPPTRAHVALADLTHSPANGDGSREPLLLLLAVQNADKPPPDPTRDASYVQRLQMMIILAQQLGPRAAVAVTMEPTFVGKARALRRWLGAQDMGTEAPKLSFLVGYDTLQRILAPKYYGSPDAMRAALHSFFEEDGARLVVARRDAAAYPAFDGGEDMPALLEEFREGIEERDFEEEEGGVSAERLTMISSSAVRKAVSREDPSWPELVPRSIAEYIRENGLYRQA